MLDGLADRHRHGGFANAGCAEFPNHGDRPQQCGENRQREAEQLIEKELVDLKLLTRREIGRQNADEPAFKKYFMHGVGPR